MKLAVFLVVRIRSCLAALPVFSSSYHPRNHPICNDEQNAIAIAWREYHAAGNNTHALTDDDMVEIGAV